MVSFYIGGWSPVGAAPAVADSAVLAGKVIRPKGTAAPASIGGRGTGNIPRLQDPNEDEALLKQVIQTAIVRPRRLRT